MTATEEIEAFRAAIDAKYRLHERAFEDKDPEPILTRFFTPDALWEYHGYPRHEGREALRGLFEEVVQKDRVKVIPIRSWVAGDAGWDFTDYRVTPRDPDEPGWTFRQMFYWVRIEGEWLVNACIGFTLPESENPSFQGVSR